MNVSRLSRRGFVRAAGAAAGLAAMPAWAQGHALGSSGHRMKGGAPIRVGFDEVSGAVIDLSVGHGPRVVQGRKGHGIAVNGSVPGPLIRLREGQYVRLNVTNHLDEDTSIHWHGLLVPFHMDGVPGISFPGIRPGQTFTYEFPIRQSGTYWYHSHSGLQEQQGHYGPLIIDPASAEPVDYDREFILLLSEFTPLHPHTIMEKLRKGEGYFNYQQTSWADDYPLTAADRRMWAEMRMPPTDIADVTGSTYTYLANGRGPKEGLEYLFTPGERIRLRIINGAAQTFFNLRIPGLPMTVIAADGQNVKPVEVDEFQIGAAETYDVIVTPTAEAYTVVAESMDRSGMALATLASRPGARAAIPPPRKAPLLDMGDMGMNHGEMGAGHSMDGMAMRDTLLLPPDVKVGPGIDMVSMAPVDKLGDPGLGLRDVGHRVLTYRMLSALEPNRDTRTPSRLLELHLTGNMERYMWSFDGEMYSAVHDKPIRFAWNERVRVKLVNNTMMAHPIHLHGMFFELVNGEEPAHQPRKNIVIVQPGASAQFDLSANEPGDWAFHCHLLYHMHGGMMQTVTVMAPDA
ncbi:copper resistance system multicopper oxidase [Erythrobacter sp. BLCC-B19]|uniref:copper resistance system multicopper oxidase n=1 Tax=Erythrobacter sp. BLCC-B19 TaxID=3025315 RepID=UPI00235F2B8A|nr:copper resistance system multicopper oxidase [Erythrobacter sp. BLCC-B19]WDA40991.1 copper resistance system multicopper oxidase [Erythrobacter sp. BLCC-B19]